MSNGSGGTGPTAVHEAAQWGVAVVALVGLVAGVVGPAEQKGVLVAAVFDLGVEVVHGQAVLAPAPGALVPVAGDHGATRASVLGRAVALAGPGDGCVVLRTTPLAAAGGRERPAAVDAGELLHGSGEAELGDSLGVSELAAHLDAPAVGQGGDHD